MSGLDTFKGLAGDLARPFAIWTTSAAAALATVRIAWRGENFIEAAAFIAAVYTGVGALYGVKSWENAKTTKANKEVEIAKAATASASPSGSAEMTTPGMAVTVDNTGAAGDGELPPDQRVNL